MIAILKSFLMQQLNFAKSPLSPTLSRLRAREFEDAIFAIMPSPVSGRGCATARERGYLPIAKRVEYAK